MTRCAAVSKGAACITACPVPSCSACCAQDTASWANAAGTAAPPWPYTTWIAAGFRLRAVSSTYCSRGLPASGCSTFGNADFMRLPAPAARTITAKGGAAGRALGLERGRADFLAAMMRLNQRQPRLHARSDEHLRVGMNLAFGGFALTDDARHVRVGRVE